MNSVREAIRSRRFWYFDLLLILLYSVGIGFLVQRSADSGQIENEKIFETITAAVSSYLIAFFIVMAWKSWRPKHVYWVSAPILGSMIFAFVYGIVLFIARSSIDDSLLDKVSEHFSFLAFRLAFQWILFAIPILLLLALVRFPYFLFHNRYRDVN